MVTKNRSVLLEIEQIEFAHEKMLNLSELIRYLINNYLPYKEWSKTKYGRRN